MSVTAWTIGASAIRCSSEQESFPSTNAQQQVEGTMWKSEEGDLSPSITLHFPKPLRVGIDDDFVPLIEIRALDSEEAGGCTWCTVWTGPEKRTDPRQGCCSGEAVYHFRAQTVLTDTLEFLFRGGSCNSCAALKWAILRGLTPPGNFEQILHETPNKETLQGRISFLRETRVLSDCRIDFFTKVDGRTSSLGSLSFFRSFLRSNIAKKEHINVELPAFVRNVGDEFGFVEHVLYDLLIPLNCLSMEVFRKMHPIRLALLVCVLFRLGWEELACFLCHRSFDPTEDFTGFRNVFECFEKEAFHESSQDPVVTFLSPVTLTLAHRLREMKNVPDDEFAAFVQSSGLEDLFDGRKELCPVEAHPFWESRFDPSFAPPFPRFDVSERDAPIRPVENGRFAESGFDLPNVVLTSSRRKPSRFSLLDETPGYDGRGGVSMRAEGLVLLTHFAQTLFSFSSEDDKSSFMASRTVECDLSVPALRLLAEFTHTGHLRGCLGPRNFDNLLAEASPMLLMGPLVELYSFVERHEPRVPRGIDCWDIRKAILWTLHMLPTDGRHFKLALVRNGNSWFWSSLGDQFARVIEGWAEQGRVSIDQLQDWIEKGRRKYDERQEMKRMFQLVERLADDLSAVRGEVKILKTKVRQLEERRDREDGQE